MNKIKCPYCGIVNWTSAEKCIRCKNEISADDGFDAPAPPPNTNHTDYESDATGSFRTRLLYGLTALLGLVFIYNIFLKPSTDKTQSNVANSNSAPPVEFSVAPPPADLKVFAPKIEQLATQAKYVIAAENTNTFSTVQPSSPPTDPYAAYARERGFSGENNSAKIDEEVTRRVDGRVCSPHVSDCMAVMQGIRNDVVRENNEAAAARVAATQMRCPPQIQGEIKLLDSGKYFKYGDEVYYFVKVHTFGLTGSRQNMQCAYKPSVGGFSASVYLKSKITASGVTPWQPSNIGEISSAGADARKKAKEERNRVKDEETLRKFYRSIDSNEKMAGNVCVAFVQD